jgi:hypothetical protein
MAPLSSDDKPTPTKEHAGISLGTEHEQLHTMALDPPTKMSPVRDDVDNTGATPQRDVAHSDHPTSKAKQMPTLEVPDDLALTTDEKHLLESTPVPSVKCTGLDCQVTDYTHTDTEHPRDAALVSSANGLDHLDNVHGITYLLEVNAHGEKSISPEKDSVIPGSVNDTSSLHQRHMYGGATVSLANSACAKFVRRLVHCMRPYIMHHLDRCKFPDMDRFLFEFAARVLLTMYDDLQRHGTDGFLYKLLNSPFGLGITSNVRSHWAEHPGLVGTGKEMHQWHQQNPSIQIQRTNISFCTAMESKIKQKSMTYDQNLLVRDKLHASSTRVTQFNEQFHKQADYYPDLLIAIDSQPAIFVLPQKLPPRIKNHKAMCTEANICTTKQKHAAVLQENHADPAALNPDGDAPPNELGNEYKHFALFQGRITPCRALVTENKNPDPFTKREELILYKCYKAVVKVPFVEGETKDSSKAWLEQWAKIAEVLLGRGIRDCIAYYLATRENFLLE